MWFGTRAFMRWVKAPTVGMPSSRLGRIDKSDYLNGGSFTHQSTTSHREYQLTWEAAKRSEIRPIMDYQDKLFGDGAIYWCDPVAMEENLLPQWLASPFQGVDDGPILTGTEVRGTELATTANTLGYPIRSITYTVAADSPVLEVWVPVPPGYTIWVGAHGQDRSGGKVVATPTTGPTTTGTPVDLALLPATSETRVNQSFSGDTYSGVLLSLGGVGTVTLSGLMVQVFPNGITPATGDFVSGQGHSGCSFSDWSSYTPYSSALDINGLVVNMTETEGWRV
jgi:hypothetical protein